MQVVGMPLGDGWGLRMITIIPFPILSWGITY
jgi:hypothetical protein